jgi:hypothetical protein
MKVVDHFPTPNDTGVRPICQGQVSEQAREQNAAYIERLKQQGRIGQLTLYKSMRRRNKFNIPLEQCQAYARYRIDDKWFCRRHAAVHVLDNLAEKTDVKA